MRRRIALMAFACSCSLLLSAQEKITGKITDESGEALAGASVIVKGTTVGVVSDTEGNYSILTENEATLEASFLGYISQEIKVDGRTAINFVLSEEMNSLAEVVVTAMGIRKDTRKVGYAVSAIDAKELTKVGAPNFASALYGKAAGVRIQSAPGGNTSAVSMTVR